ncbi:glycosyltransferase family 39 protein [Candidatus Clostridium radicumherbarum]|uniref:Glycosyltransferase family 39 protein n=1 Tax=Candidatus Clostridium radicumherbarum TaxID=3381662 RepID=A0ABW8TSH0_9CLOT
MKKIKLTKETIALSLITLLSAMLNFVNLNIEGTANAYYAAAVKSMTMSLKNFFFVAFDPSSFVTIDKPPLGYWFQAISAKVFGFSGWSIILPQALAGVISVIVIYFIVKRSFGTLAGLISSLCLAVTPVFVAASRNNTVDNVLVLALLLACWTLSIAAEKGKFKYLILSMVLIGIGFNIKMLQAYMIIPAIYITYLLTSAVTFKKRLLHLTLGTVVLLVVSLSWALIVDAVPASNRPYVDSSTNNTVMELIVGHNGLERLSLSSNSSYGGGPMGAPSMNGQAPQGLPGGNGQTSEGKNNSSTDATASASQNQNSQPQASSGNSSTDTTANASQNQSGGDNQGFPGNPPSNGGGMTVNPPNGGGQMGGPGTGNSAGLQGTFGGQTPSSITRLFSKNILSDQIAWFIPLAVIGFIAAAIKEKLKFKLDNSRKQSLVLWFMWFLPVFLYFSFNTGTFHSYYLTMLAPPVAALTGIGITVMWELYREKGWKSWFLTASLIANGVVQLLMLSYFSNASNIIKVLMILLIVLCFGASIVLSILKFMEKNDFASENDINDVKQNKNLKLKQTAVSIALIGLLVTPLVGSAAAMFYGLNGSFPAAGLELLSSNQAEGRMMAGNIGITIGGSGNSALINFLLKNKTSSQKYLLVVSSANDAADIIINTGESVMAIGGFLGNDKSITLDQFKELVKNGEVRYVMTGGDKGGNGGGSTSSEIMAWVKENGTVVASSEYSGTNGNLKIDNTSSNNISNTSNSNNSQENPMGFGGGDSDRQLYDLKAYTESLSKNIK